MRRTLIATLCLLAIAGAAEGGSRRRVALVIGNSAYKDNSLPSAASDARAVRDELKNLEISPDDLLECFDCKKGEMQDVIANFRRKLQTADEAVFYYSGHGAEINSPDGPSNFMLPVDAVPVNPKNFYNVTVAVADVYEAMRVGSSRFNLVILDACRNNPFVTDGSGIQAQLAEPRFQEIPVGTLIAFSTRPGTLAIDGSEGGHSPYTDALLQFMARRGMTIQDYFMRVRNKVQDNTAKGQTPWETTSQMVDFAFSSPAELGITIQDGDDEVIVFSNGQAVLWSRDGRATRPIRLHTGDNVVEVYVHNDKSHRDDKSWLPREGWKFDVRLQIVPENQSPPTPISAEILCSDVLPQIVPENQSPPTPISAEVFCGAEDPPANERWGATFLAAAARVNVSEKGAIAFTVIENEVWRDAFSVADNSRRDELELSLAWPFWHGPIQDTLPKETLRLYDDSYPGQRRPVNELRAAAIAAHNAAGGTQNDPRRGSSQKAHIDAVVRLTHATDQQLEEALLRLRHWEVGRQAHGIVQNVQWAVGKNRDFFFSRVAHHDFGEVRSQFEELQSHNPMVRNLLGLLSNEQIEKTVNATP
jgi:hypothetical protein